MPRSRLHALCGWIMLPVGWAAAAGEPPPAPRSMAPPHIVVIMTDDQGYGDVGAHGNPAVRTPHLDAFFHESVGLDQFQVSPVCSPTRSSLLTGRYNYRTGVVDTYVGRSLMRPDEVTLAERLRQAGYRTGIFGKWHLGDNCPLRPEDQGFDEVLVHNGGGLTQPGDPEEGHYQDPLLRRNGVWKRHAGYCSDVYTEAAIEFLKQRPERPAFVYLAFNCPHTPLEVAEELVAPYRAAGLDETTARVYAMVTNIDDNVGRLLRALRELGIERNTLVVFLTDNGPQQPRYNAGMRGLKGTVYQGGIRVPCYVRWPARLAARAGAKVDRIAAHIDLFPTLLEAAGVEPGETVCDGRSLWPLLDGTATNADWPERRLFVQWHRGDVPERGRACAVRTQRYKLVQAQGVAPGPFGPEMMKWELFDLEADPAESRDLSQEHPEIVRELRAAYDAWFDDVSRRGFEPPRIVIGSPRENPTRLSRQDWRGPRSGWAADSIGGWEVEIASAGIYDVTVRTAPASSAGRRKVVVTLGGRSLEGEAEPGQTELMLRNWRLPAGPGRLEATLTDAEGKTSGPTHLVVRRADP